MAPHFVVTGGHHNSALVVATALTKKGAKVDWIGHRYTSRRDQNDSAEYLEVRAAGLLFHELKAGKFGRSVGVGDLLRIPSGLLSAYRLLARLKPKAVLAFGGYLGFAVGVAAVLRGIPLYLHEQTIVAGLGNKVLARFARQIFLTWPDSRNHFPRAKSQVVGLPLRPAVLKPSRLKFFTSSRPTLLVTGGKQGSHIINQHIFANLTELLTQYNLVHQTGTNSTTNDYHSATKLQAALPPELENRYLVKGYIGESEMGTLLNSVDLVIGRSGAHTTYELGIVGTPALLIPYLATHGTEQLHHARYLEKHGSALILPESELTGPRLLGMIPRALALPRRPLPLPRDAAQAITTTLLAKL